MTFELKAQQDKTAKTDWMSIFQLVFSLLVLLGYISLGFLAGWAQTLDFGLASEAANQGAMWLTLSLALFTLGALNLPSIYFASRALLGKPEPVNKFGKSRLAITLLAVFGLILTVGWFWLERLPVWILSALTILGVLIPAVWIVQFGVRNASKKRTQRNAGLLSFSLGFTTYFILLAELFALIIVLVGFSLLIMNETELFQSVLSLFARLSETPQDTQAMQDSVMALLKNPLVLGGIYLIVAVVMPIIEEVFKTLGVWFFVQKDLSPSDGYVAGLYSGAGFALVEGLLNSMQVAAGLREEWLFFLVGRAGGSLLHIFNGGLMGWALAKTWRDRKYWRIVWVLFITIGIHGFWNAIAISTGILPEFTSTPAIAASSGMYLPLVLLTIGLIAAYGMITAKLFQEKNEVAQV